ncbi:MAG TPA: zinc-dependent alcohol dehydrogenase [Pyrinomonadaceae bacterium]|nr:zinc-dependent alcohol dehydrogenase [Pyrinomonadaceae bacterium]
MKAVCWYGKKDVQVMSVPDPSIINPHDAVIKITTTAICGSDLHLYDGYIPTMEAGDILGHEFMGEVVEVGSEVTKLKVGDRVVVPFTISCGNCFFCKRELWSLCDNTNPNAGMAETMYGFSCAGLFGYSHLTGGYAGGQAEYARVPFADVGAIKIPEGIPDEKVLFLSDIFPTGYMAAENCNIQPGDTVAVWGCGPVGQFAIKSAYLLGAEKVIAIDHIPERLRLAVDESKAEAVNCNDANIHERLKELTGGLGPDACIDAVGLEAHGTSFDAIYDYAKAALYLTTDRLHALRQAVYSCRKGGTVSVPGVYGGFLDKFPFGAAFQKGLTFKMGQTHVRKYMQPLLQLIEDDKIDPSFIITHRFSLDDAPEGYDTFRNNPEECFKVVMKPNGNGNGRYATSH